MHVDRFFWSAFLCRLIFDFQIFWLNDKESSRLIFLILTVSSKNLFTISIHKRCFWPEISLILSPWNMDVTNPFEIWCNYATIFVMIFMPVAGSILSALGQILFHMFWFLEAWTRFLKNDNFHFLRWGVWYVIIISMMTCWNLTISSIIQSMRITVSSESYFLQIIYRKDVMNVSWNLKIVCWKKITIFFFTITKLDVAGTSNYQSMYSDVVQYSITVLIFISKKFFMISMIRKLLTYFYEQG